VTPALGSKNPQVKEGSLKFLIRCLSTSPAPIQPAQVKPLSEQLGILLEDSFEGARNEAATAFGTLMRMVGERPLNAIMDGLPDVRKSKVKEAFEKATVQTKASASGPPKPSGPPPAKAPKKRTVSKKTPTPVSEDASDTFTEPQKVVKKPPAPFLVCPRDTWCENYQ
jgi:cytoskeleton-associated protein 5